jgi:AraC-like DNA-binding protein
MTQKNTLRGHPFLRAEEDDGRGGRPSTHQVLTSSDISTVTHVLSDAYGDVTVRLPLTSHRLSMRLEAFNLPNVTLGNLALSSSLALAPNYPRYLVCLPVSGRIRISNDGMSSVVGGNQGVVISPGTVEVEYLTDDCRMQTIMFEPSSLDAELSSMLGRPIAAAPHFELGLDLTGRGGGAFQRAAALLAGELLNPEGMTCVPAMAVQLGRLAMTGLLVGQQHNYSEALSGDVPAPGSRAIRTALAIIEERPAELQAVADIAKACGLSVRSLDEGFRRHVGLSPMTYLRQVRLARAHDELAGADPDSTTATVVARNWGFWHYGRFAAEYRKRYGRTPAETLRGPRVGGR